MLAAAVFFKKDWFVILRLFFGKLVAVDKYVNTGYIYNEDRKAWT